MNMPPQSRFPRLFPRLFTPHCILRPKRGIQISKNEVSKAREFSVDEERLCADRLELRVNIASTEGSYFLFSVILFPEAFLIRLSGVCQ